MAGSDGHKRNIASKQGKLFSIIPKMTIYFHRRIFSTSSHAVNLTAALRLQVTELRSGQLLVASVLNTFLNAPLTDSVGYLATSLFVVGTIAIGCRPLAVPISDFFKHVVR
jgi:hypothetical protein